MITSSNVSVPNVGLITSWMVTPQRSPVLQVSKEPCEPLGLQQALQEGISFLDLYFLSHQEIPWYADEVNKARESTKPTPDAALDTVLNAGSGETGAKEEQEPHAFVASLRPKDLDGLAVRLRQRMTEWYEGRLVGRRPRIGSFATFFPNLSHDDSHRREQAIQALRNTLYLAASLGAHCVEIVGGAGVPERERNMPDVSPYEHRANRLNALSDALVECYRLDRSNPLTAFRNEQNRLPFLSLELEPGPAFLLNDLPAFQELRKLVDTKLQASRSRGEDENLIDSKLCLNVDIAHAFLIGYNPKKLREERLEQWISHIHLSDHGGTKGEGGMHACDLQPDTFHYFEEYYEWLDFAIELMRLPGNRYSGAIAIEMEACCDIIEAMGAMQITRQWLNEIGRLRRGTRPSALTQKPANVLAFDDVPAFRLEREGQEQMVVLSAKQPQMAAPASADPYPELTGAILVADIGNSTSQLLKQGNEQLKAAVQELCQLVLDLGGSVMSFTGDGMIALFERAHFSRGWEAANQAFAAAWGICHAIRDRQPQADTDGVTVRVALHWGNVSLPATGSLRDQAIGKDVVRAARLCDWIGKNLEPAQPPKTRCALRAATHEFVCVLAELETKADGKQGTAADIWTYWGAAECKGLDEKTQIYVAPEIVHF